MIVKGHISVLPSEIANTDHFRIQSSPYNSQELEINPKSNIEYLVKKSDFLDLKFLDPEIYKNINCLKLYNE
ncbi:hypothetical protein PIROE2DRAFT_14216 [Piromyces sp. E2]|nr:hypothetical protein PIROE2DRAFT_14216 [Piromyces sp. E2]|eukprot:OUM60091.1 hypothetical protein PIROE2DRAFT_14216 [Piromyces sp. E2]